jgi:Yip1 domain
MSSVPQPVSAPTPEAKPLSQVERIVDVFIAPRKTFTDLRRSAAWWAPWLLIIVVSISFVYVGGEKVGFRKIMENQMKSQPKQQARLEQLPPDQREKQLQAGAQVTKVISYSFWIIQLIILMIVTLVLWGTFKFAIGADVSFNLSLAIVIYASLPGIIKALLAMLSLLAGASVDSFTFQNPVATNPGYFMDPTGATFLYSIMSALDVFLIWTLILTAIGFTCVSPKIKMGTALAVVFGWWLVLTLGASGLGAAFA